MELSILNNEKNTIIQDTIKLMAKYDPYKNSDICQIKIDETEITKDWLETIELLAQTSRSRIIKANMNICKEEQQKIVILKLSNNDSLYKEYLIGRYMSKKNPNFMNYTCYFQCDDQLNKYNKKSIKKYLCNGKGDELKILIMPFYKLGSFKDFSWKSVEKKILVSCTAQILAAYLYAYNNIGFLHNDCHLGNILIDETTEKEFIYKINDEIINIPVFGYKIIIMDYETTLFDRQKVNSIILIKDILKLITDIIHKNEVDSYFYKTNIKINSLLVKNNYIDLVNIIKYLLSSLDEL